MKGSKTIKHIYLKTLIILHQLKLQFHEYYASLKTTFHKKGKTIFILFYQLSNFLSLSFSLSLHTKTSFQSVRYLHKNVVIYEYHKHKKLFVQTLISIKLETNVHSLSAF